MKNQIKDNIALGFAGAWSRITTFAIAFLIVSCFSACYEQVDGCLDTNALNFSLDADRECDGCCTYPALSIRLVHQWIDADTSFTFRYTSGAFKDGGGNPFVIDRITYYLQNFSLVTDAGTRVSTTDTVLVGYLNDIGFYEDRYIPDDYLLINATVSSAFEVGTLAQNGNFTQLQFELGVDDFMDRILPGSLTNNHPLSLLDTTMYDLNNGRYVSNRLDLARDTTQNAEDLLLQYGAERSTVPVSVAIPGGFPLPAGFNMVVTLQVNYAEWFQNVNNIATATPETIIPQIVAGLPNSFTLVDITVNQQ
ncbi:MbnP family protein [Flavilitoribacter nigricans]|uniref:Copper-binding protein MbnP-like domain-containing protein n=1 Tax=Flavilitoribacter nigricans (strain ATCC 23147 / DSM 23189 / NBRC 102662 / NCIMB 1420 / SS-2) TaxID=1122177 RepID=A0A2D0NBM7_FLAN2|nr:MbnP family protein [Flavilitoribacter nigricans]PHN05770.1 hypothetical protein CRP01_14950 [Flavilitoribacter nigricans DSM 23189 = NBRC 102662]